VCPNTPNADSDTAVGRAIRAQAGEELANECRDYVQTHGKLTEGVPVCTAAGKLSANIQTIMHIVAPDLTNDVYRDNSMTAQEQLTQCYYNCIKEADRLGQSSICIPALGTGVNTFDVWTIAHCAARAMRKYIDARTDKSGYLRSVEFINLTLSLADIMSCVFREVFRAGTPQQQVGSRDSDVTEQTTQQPAIVDTQETIIEDKRPDQVIGNETRQTAECDGGPSPPTVVESEWIPIERIVKHRRLRNKDQFLVKWLDGSPDSWIPKKDVSMPALEAFYKSHPRMRKRRPRHY
jgi:O-acetyl-ADP-ribose deacetylase (regulator of RNase III)